MRYSFLTPITLLPLLTPFVAFAQAPAPCVVAGTYRLIAPVGSLSTNCLTLREYMNGVFTTAIGLAGVLAVIMIVICGIKLMGSGSVSGKSEAKQCIWNAIFGVLLAIGSWLLLNTINPLLLRNDAEIQIESAMNSAAGTRAARTENQPTVPGCFFRYRMIDTGDVRYSGAATGEMCAELRREYQRDTPHVEVQTACFCNVAGAAPAPVVASTPPPTTTGVACLQSGMNLCEEQNRQCTNSRCARFAGWAAQYAGGVATANFLKALILQESSCVARPTDIVGFDGLSAGPIHLTPSTANRFKTQCGVPSSVNITIGWLAAEVNWGTGICIASRFIQTLPAACGNDIRNIAAGYNGGGGACSPSNSCSGNGCSGERVRRWECLYDDAAHQRCNGGNSTVGGYNVTRNYATNVLYCTNHPGY